MINQLSEEELAKFAEKELGENPSKLKKDVESLQDWISKSPHLQCIRKDDDFLLAFLRGCKYSLERTKEKLDFFFTVRGNLPEWFDNWDPSLKPIQECLSQGTILPLRGYDKDGRYTFLLRPGKVDTSIVKLNDMIKCQLMMIELAGRFNRQAILKGIVVIQDFSYMTAAMATQINLPTIKKATVMFQDAFPSKPKAFHILNLPSVMETVFGMFQSFLKKKMKERQIIHPKGDLSKLQDAVGLDILPKEYGGTNGTIQDHIEFWKKEAESNSSWFQEQSTYKTEESKRQGKPKQQSDLFGIEGSFRKLEID